MGDYADGCGEFRALASIRLDGELDELESARLERHLGVCGPCMTWTREVGALAKVLNESTSVAPTWSSDDLSRPLRWRFVRATSVGAAAVSAAAAAALLLAQPGGGLSLFSSGRGTSASEALCASCMKKQAVTFSFSSRARSTTPQRDAAAPIRTHVTSPNPLVEP
jgi:predicted anti-sigma-YlaC factor YlaD